jgi:MFS family permease
MSLDSRTPRNTVRAFRPASPSGTDSCEPTVRRVVKPRPSVWTVLGFVTDALGLTAELPHSTSDLGFSQSDLAWVFNAYLISFGGLLLLAGRIGDLVGQRRVFLAGLGVFTVASLVCALADSQGVLIGGRFVQGIGGALTSAVILGMIFTMFPDPRERARAIGIYTFVAVAGGSVGLLAGGLLTEALNWHWIFFVNIPIGVATALLAVRLVDDTPGIGWSRGADILGAALLAAGLMIGVYAIIGVESTVGHQARPWPWGSWQSP